MMRPKYLNLSLGFWLLWKLIGAASLQQLCTFIDKYGMTLILIFMTELGGWEGHYRNYRHYVSLCSVTPEHLKTEGCHQFPSQRHMLTQPRVHSLVKWIAVRIVESNRDRLAIQSKSMATINHFDLVKYFLISSSDKLPMKSWSIFERFILNFQDFHQSSFKKICLKVGRKNHTSKILLFLLY